MKRKHVILAVGIVAVTAVLFFVVGPFAVKGIVKSRLAQVPPRTKSVPIRIKASGTVSVAESHVVLTTPHGRNNYVLVGVNEKEFSQFAEKKQTVFVFGSLMKPSPKKVGDKTIRYCIDVAQFNTKDFEIGSKVSPEVLSSIKRKVDEKSAFREATLKKLGVSGQYVDAITGKLVVIGGCLYAGDPKEQYAVLLKDKYGDYYFLLNGGAMKKPYSQYTTLATSGLDVVVVGKVSIMDPSITTVLNPSLRYVPFMATKIYNADLSELILEKEIKK